MRGFGIAALVIAAVIVLFVVAYLLMIVAENPTYGTEKGCWPFTSFSRFAA
jgi:hypothetical protein